jgi:hypothetical protein
MLMVAVMAYPFGPVGPWEILDERARRGDLGSSRHSRGALGRRNQGLHGDGRCQLGWGSAGSGRARPGGRGFMR